MKLPVPILDNRTYDDIVREAKRLISQNFKEWTDFNASDPGITLVELFAWMTEMLIYRVNRVPEKNLLAFLNFIGIQRKPASPATALLTFSSKPGMDFFYVPQSTQVDATQTTERGDPIRFTTEKGVNLSSTKLKSVLTWSEQFDDNTEKALGQRAGDFEIFQGRTFIERALYLGDTKLFGIASPGVTVELTFAIPQTQKPQWQIFWEYWDGAIWQNLPEVEDTTERLGRSGKVTLKNVPASAARRVASTLSNWIRCRLTPLDKGELFPSSKYLPAMQSVRAKTNVDLTRQDLRPDAALYQSVEAPQPFPLDVSKEFYPFAKLPQKADTFYFSFDEAFSKPTARVDIAIQVEPIENVGTKIQDNLNRLKLRWEYFDGEQWSLLGESNAQRPAGSAAPNPAGKYFFSDGTYAFTQNGHVTFDVPLGIGPWKTPSGELHWMRARLVEGGYDSRDDEAKTFAPPFIRSLRMAKYEYKVSEPAGEPRQPKFCVAHRDFVFEDCTLKNQLEAGFQPFNGREQAPALYLGFDRPFSSGRAFGLHFSINEARLGRTTENVIAAPAILWHYWNGKDWAQFTELHDRTATLTRTGFVDFVAPIDHALNTDLLNIHELTADLLLHQQQLQQTLKKAKTPQEERELKKQLAEIETSLRRYQPLTEAKNLFWFRALWQDGSQVESPRARLIRLNTTEAINVVTVNEELLGSSDGTPKQLFTLSQTPVHGDPQIFVVEPNANPAAGETTTVRQLWQRQEDFFVSRPDDRHYTLDEDSGVIEFGDGQHGRTPPEGVNNIIAMYQWHAGKQGNLPAGAIKSLINDIPEIESEVLNQEPSGGGAESETVEEARYRGIQTLRHQYRAVSLADFEGLAREASAMVGATKAFDDPYRPGEVTVHVVPKPKVDREGKLNLREKLLPTNALLEQVRAYLDERRLITTKLRVIEPKYLSIIIELTAALKPYPREALVLEEIKKTLIKFLHPTAGGPEGTGWPFGRTLHVSEIFAQAEQINGVDVVKSVRFTDENSRELEVKNELPLAPEELFFLKDVQIIVK